MGSQNSSIVNGFIDEVKTYLPSLYSGIETLRRAPLNAAVIQELHRLVHIVHGAASLVGLPGLSHTASPMEEALDEVMLGALGVDEPLLAALSSTVGWFDAYTRGEVTCREREVAIVTETVRLFRRLRGLPESGDGEVLRSVLDDLKGEAEFEAIAVSGDDGMALSLVDDPFDFAGSGGDLPFAEAGEVADFDPFSFGMPDAGPLEVPSVRCVAPVGTAVPAVPGAGREAAVDPEILAVFYDEVEEHFESINRHLEALENEVTRTLPLGEGARERIRQIRRAVHTIKGASSLVGMTGLPAWAHSVEDLLDWLYDDAVTMAPEMVSVLLRSTDIMERHLSDPDRVSSDEMALLRGEFLRITGAPAVPAADAGPGALQTDGPEASSGLFDLRFEEEEDPDTDGHAVSSVMPQKSSGTFRVGMAKLDELVNLASEQIIALSAFDQKLDAFLSTVAELDRSRTRLRETARNLEVGYEVTSIQGAGGGVVPAVPHGGGDAFGDFHALELDRYSEFNLMIRALSESAVDIGEIYSGLQTFHSDFDGYVTRQRVLLSELQGKLMQIRMAPMSVMTTRMRRAVREVADALGKKVRLTLRGEGIELDRVIWEKLADPLLHILRNAVDHGIETPGERVRAGKPETGVIAVTASREGNQVLIRIRDDGAGLDFHAIRRRAGEVLGDEAAAMGDEELLALLFMPGFSTRRDVTEISGRGVGMDVVKSNIEELKGTVRIAPAEGGSGTVLTVRIPLTLAVIRAILCTAGGQTFAVPLNEISDILRVYPENRIHEPMESVRVGDEIFPLYHLCRVLGLPDAAPAQPRGEHPIVLKIVTPQGTAAFAVDALLGQREIVIKSLGSHLHYVKGISGATVMGDGRLVPILNVGELFSGEAGAMPDEVPGAAGAPLEILIVDDSVSVRQVVARLLEGQGWKTSFARDGQEALDRLSALTPDLIVLDVEMPRMNGYEFLSARRSHPAYRKIPVIMLTSRSTAKYREKARGLGADGYVVKPFNDQEFLHLIHSLTVR